MATEAKPDNLFERALALWPRAQVVFEGPSWEGKPEAAALTEAIAEHGSELEAQLIANVNHPNHLIAAYCLVTLERIKSNALRSLPAALLERTEKVTWRLGSFSQMTELGAYARHKRKVALTR